MRGKVMILISILVLISQAWAVRLKDIMDVDGVRGNYLVGYGLVVGLKQTGDGDQTKFTVQSIVNMLERFGIVVPKSQVKLKNVAAVMVTAYLPPYVKPGQKIEIKEKSKNNPQTKRVKDFYTPSIQKIVKELFKANKKEFEIKLETIEKEFIKIIKESPYYNKELVEAIKRSNIYYSLDKKGSIKFLKEHNYTGIENISGNVLVMVDHKNKKVTTGKKENI